MNEPRKVSNMWWGTSINTAPPEIFHASVGGKFCILTMCMLHESCFKDVLVNVHTAMSEHKMYTTRCPGTLKLDLSSGRSKTQSTSTITLKYMRSPEGNKLANGPPALTGNMKK